MRVRMALSCDRNEMWSALTDMTLPGQHAGSPREDDYVEIPFPVR